VVIGSTLKPITVSSESNEAMPKVCRVGEAPAGEIAIVFSDIAQAMRLWEFSPRAMKEATIAYNELLRSTLSQFGGYEVISK